MSESINRLKTEQVEIPPIGLEYLKMTPEVKTKMSLNEADQQFLFELIKQMTDNVKAEQANTLNAQNALIYLKLEMLQEGTQIFIRNKAAIEKVGQYENRLSVVEYKTSLGVRLQWLAAGLIIGVGIGLLVMALLHGPF